jgi:hypothetical protein
MVVQPSKMVYYKDANEVDSLLIASANKRRIVQRDTDGGSPRAFAFGIANGIYGMAVNPADNSVWVSLGGLEHKIIEVGGSGEIGLAYRPGELCFDGSGVAYYAPFRAGPGETIKGNVYKGNSAFEFYAGGHVVALAADDEDSVYVGDRGAGQLVKLDDAGNVITTLSGVEPVEILVADLELYVLMADRSIWRLKRDDLMVTGVEPDTRALAATTLAMDERGRLHLSGMAWPAINGIFAAWIFQVTG